MNETLPAETHASHDSDRGWRRLFPRLMWLLYLGLYPVPWIGNPPSSAGVAASAAAIAVFLAIYWHAVSHKAGSRLPHIVAIAAIGFALSPFGGAWSVLNVFAATLAARIPSRRTAIVTVSALLMALAGFGLASGAIWIAWVSGIFFSLLAAGGTFLQADLERRHQQLLAAQDEVRTLAASSERERIARDLHDLLGHTLTLVAVKAELASRLAERDATAARQEMEQVATVAREALSEVRLAVTGMQGATLAAEIGRARAMLAAADVEASVEADPVSADPRGEAVLAMALREAVTNVIRHAGAKSCTIGYGVDASGGMRLSVTDDGTGGALAEGFGLSGMRARLFAAGGALTVESGQAGTHLLAVLPASSRPQPA